MADEPGENQNIPADHSVNSVPGPSVDPQDRPITAHTLAQIVNNAVLRSIAEVKNQFDSELSVQKSATQDASRELQKLKAKKVSFRFRGNKEQFDFNEKILDTIDKAHQAASLAESKVLLETAQKDINYRNKLIKLADKSEAGWGAVEEYTADDLAEGSDDDRKIRTSQARALAKKNKLKPNRKPYRRAPVASPHNPAYGDTYSSRYNPSFNSAGRNIPGSFRGQGFRAQSGYNRPQYYGQGARTTDICFACGKSGHWRKACPSINSK